MNHDPQPELPIDPPIDTDTPVDWDAMAEDLGCVEYHRWIEEME